MQTYHGEDTSQGVRFMFLQERQEGSYDASGEIIYDSRRSLFLPFPCPRYHIIQRLIQFKIYSM